jgi:hypothetical protein
MCGIHLEQRKPSSKKFPEKVERQLEQHEANRAEVAPEPAPEPSPAMMSSCHIYQRCKEIS